MLKPSNRPLCAVWLQMFTCKFLAELLNKWPYTTNRPRLKCMPVSLELIRPLVLWLIYEHIMCVCVCTHLVGKLAVLPQRTLLSLSLPLPLSLSHCLFLYKFVFTKIFFFCIFRCLSDPWLALVRCTCSTFSVLVFGFWVLALLLLLLLLMFL